MADDFPSSNPFRRKATSAVDPPIAQTDSNITSARDPLPAVEGGPFDGSRYTIPEPVKLQPKITKKVRVQSPPPSSLDDIPPPFEPPIPIPRFHVPEATDPFDNLSEAPKGSEAATAAVRTNYVPANPFQKTLATLEGTDGVQDEPTALGTIAQKGGKASMDVDAFKRLLMTGNTGNSAGSGVAGNSSFPPPRFSSGNVQPTNIPHQSVTDGTSTDTSSVSKQSLFEPIQENHPESPRTSHEISDQDNERGPFRTATLSPKPEKKKPPPPSSKHGKLIKVELRDDYRTGSLQSPTLLNSKRSQQSLNSRGSAQSQSSPTDLNKPLPHPPAPRASHESDRESIFDVESAGKIPEPSSPSPSVKRKTPPPPPVSRRLTQIIPDSKINPSPSGAILPNPEEPWRHSEASPSQPKPPRPPPSRRPASIRNTSSYEVSTTSPPILSPGSEITSRSQAPAPPPTRMASKRMSGRPPSVHSLDMSTKRSSNLPPPPPPRQRASSKSSMEAPTSSPGRGSLPGDFSRRPSQASQLSQVSQAEDLDTGNDPAPATSNILADLAALQREVDALRGKHQGQRTDPAKPY